MRTSLIICRLAGTSRRVFAEYQPFSVAAFNMYAKKKKTVVAICWAVSRDADVSDSFKRKSFTCSRNDTPWICWHILLGASSKWKTKHNEDILRTWRLSSFRTPWVIKLGSNGGAILCGISATLRWPAAAIDGPDLELERPRALPNYDANLALNPLVVRPFQISPLGPPAGLSSSWSRRFLFTALQS